MLDFFEDKSFNHIRNWLATPSLAGKTLMYNVQSDGRITSAEHTVRTKSIRPVVALPSTTVGQKNTEGVWQLGTSASEAIKPTFHLSTTAWTRSVTVTLGFPYLDGLKVEYSFDGDDYSPYTKPFEVTLNGEIYAKTTTKEGKIMVATMEITNIDRDAPEITSLSTSELEHTQTASQVTLTAVVNDNGSGIPETGAYEWYMDNNEEPTATTNTPTYTFTKVPRGNGVTHKFKLKVKDNIENINEKQTTDVSFSIKANELVKPANYGDKIEYNAGGVSDWKIFYADDNYIYLIPSGYLPANSLPAGVQMKKNPQVTGSCYVVFEVVPSCWISEIPKNVNTVILNKFVKLYKKNQSVNGDHYAYGKVNTRNTRLELDR